MKKALYYNTGQGITALTETGIHKMLFHAVSLEDKMRTCALTFEECLDSLPLNLNLYSFRFVTVPGLHERINIGSYGLISYYRVHRRRTLNIINLH